MTKRELVFLFVIVCIMMLFSSCGQGTGSSQSASETKVENAQYNWKVHYKTGSPLYTICALDSSHVWAAGSEGQIFFFNGKSWSRQYQAPEIKEKYHPTVRPTIYNVSAADENHAWAVGNIDYYNRGYIFFFNGNAWIEQYKCEDFILNNVFALDPSHVWAVGYGETGDRGQIRIYFYNGSSWKKQHEKEMPFTVNCSSDIYALDAEHVWVVGPEGTVLFFNGSSWSELYGIGAGTDLTSVYSASESKVWAVGDYSIFFYDGSNWIEQKENPYSMGTYREIDGADQFHVWVATGYDEKILFFNGDTWSTQYVANSEVVESISAADSVNVWAACSSGTIYLGEKMN